MASRVHDKMKHPVFHLRVSLDGVHPSVWRRIRVPGDIGLNVFHELLQVLMPWENRHLHRFMIENEEFGVPDPQVQGTATRDETGITMEGAVRLARGRFWYDYDFGDGWRHEIEILQELPWEKGSWIPICLEGARACPPEDCGGPQGYEELLKAIEDPTHERHAELRHWIDKRGNKPFDPEKFDLEFTNKMLKWTAQDFRRHAPSR
jgi:hypothetical protein